MQTPMQTSQDVMPKTHHHAARVIFIVSIVAYVLLAFVSISIFPTINTGLSAFKVFPLLFFGIGALLWIGIGLLSLQRIAAFNANRPLQQRAMIKILAVIAPLLLISLGVIFMVMREPRLPIDILDPQTTDFVAPLSITFGTDTANMYLRTKNKSVTSYTWDFGDGKSTQDTTEPHLTARYERAGIYAVTVTMHVSDGSTEVLTRTITIPKVVFSLDPEKPVIDEPVTLGLSHIFTDPNKEFVKAEWDFDNNGTFDQTTDVPSAVTTYHRVGPATGRVRITYTNNAQIEIVRTFDVVEPVKQPFDATIVTDPVTLLGPAPFGLKARVETAEQIANVTWDFGDRSSTQDGISVAHTYEKVGSFKLTASVRSQTGTTAIATKLVRVTEELELSDLKFEGTPEVNGSKVTGQLPLELNITPRTSKPLISFTWDAPGASDVLSTEKTLKAIYRKEGTYAVELIGVDTSQRVMRKHIDVVVTPPKIDVVITVDPPAPVAPATVKFDASNTFIPDGQEVTGFEWDFGDRQKRLLGSQTEYTFAEPGTYKVTLSVRTLEGSSYQKEVTVVVRAPVQDLCFLPSRDNGPAPLAVAFDVSCSTPDLTDFFWDFGDGTQSDTENPIHTFEEPGQYDVKLEAKNKDGALLERHATITVQGE